MNLVGILGRRPEAPVKRYFFSAEAFGGGAILPTMLVYYGTSANTILNASQVKALQASRNDTTTTGPYSIPYTETPEYVFVAVPTIFGPPGNRSESRGFQLNQFLTDFAGPEEGYTAIDGTSGWYYQVVNVDGVDYKVFRSRFAISGDSFTLFCT